ncbi:alpha/beta fold hydrolase [Flavobacterium sp. GT3R68]|uniref:alpha/beta fold hydrolase n=1 Tax=Flavobacterium sp. GT3R68 TaxID=2594437 RepID=UPI000F874840|nr:alpha/beta hydrolase [Flavobacterium sp. GT3R68]RTY95065.1 alpha/beta hydrolase [Flavobacterium sp. GSN2]TRW91871.1 alpha/beta hydrolase [Flavobacterium sp. GT3R68]
MRNLIYLLPGILFLTGCSSFRPGKDYVFPSKKEKEKYIYSYNQTLRLWSVPYKETDVATSFGTAHVIISGPDAGEPLILFHGTDASSTMWFPNIKELSKEHRVYAIDFPLEAGKSMSNRIKLSNKETAVFYKEVFEHFKMKNINLLGVSRGGWMATYLAIQLKPHIKRIVLLSPANTFGGIDQFWKVMTAINLKIFPNPKSLGKFFNSFSYRPDKIDAIFKEQLYLAYKYGNSKPRLLNMTQFSDANLKSLNIPVMVLIGDHDIVNSEKIFKKAHKLIPNVETEVIKDAGHFLSIDQSDIINKKILNFLKK